MKPDTAARLPKNTSSKVNNPDNPAWTKNMLGDTQIKRGHISQSSANQTTASCLMKAEKFEQQFDEGVDITASLDLSKARRVMQAQKRMTINFPTQMIESLDH